MRNWWEYSSYRFPYRGNGEMEEDRDIYKVIFLDVDGVLNPEDYTAEIRVLEDKVMLLKQIVEATGAKIVLSSSWRRYYEDFAKRGFEVKRREDGSLSNDEMNIDLLHKLLCKYGLSVDGVTPSVTTGPEARPAEIRLWLTYRPNVKRFVILDDDSFWKWGWMAPFFVRTVTEKGNVQKPFPEYDRGLTQEHVDRAIAILNEEYPYENVEEKEWTIMFSAKAREKAHQRYLEKKKDDNNATNSAF